MSTSVGRLTEARLAAEESRAETLLTIGRAGEAIGDLEAVVAEEPTRESAVALLVHALCAVGRQTDALRAFGRLRRSLVEELGVAPSEPLRRLENQVLRVELRSPAAPDFVVPCLRPLPHSSFVGRDDDLQRVVELLAVRQVVSIVGPGGVGKTRLARHAADTVRDRYTDGVIWVELSSLVDAADVPAVIANELRLSVAPGAALLDQVADALVGRRVLVVLDDCEHLADGVAVVADRIVGASTVDVLLTSRVPLRADDEQVVVLAPLAEGDAARLFLDRLGPSPRRAWSRRPTPRSSPRSSGGSTGCRWCSSSPRHACPDSDCVACAMRSTSRSASSMVVTAPDSTARCSMSSNGPFACSPTRSASCSSTWPPSSRRSSSPQ